MLFPSPISCRRYDSFGRAAGLWINPAKEGKMDTTTLLIIIVIVLLLFGGGYYGRGRWW
jgi:hypothetical protein